MWMFRTLRALWLLINLIVQCSSNLHPGFSRLEHGHRLDGSVINSFPEFSFLDCVTECLVTPRCVSVNYCKGANFCELNYEKKETANIKFPESPGWVYSEKDHWPKELAGVCSNSNCSLHEKCAHKKYTKETHFKCVISDCGIPDRTGNLDFSQTKREDAIGIHRRIHASCSEGYYRIGSGRLTCQSNGEWKYDILCEDEDGWKKYGQRIYRLATERKAWNSAKIYCESKGAYLVEIDSLDENTWVIENIIVPNLPDDCSIWGCTVWIGGNDRENEGHFVWSRDGNPTTFTNWDSGNPDNYNGNEDCIEMRHDGIWNDRRCDHRTLFVCEKDIN
ncbi:versican core protein-like [Crassostrea angulata]|uniref:versican core protein-like n=1 Tax=Magallana angulata TaxID=2784310 RepID=UPI0022B0A5AA|nr:versican core protein-like [Crassostrea angulata]